jgi:release factor glutamine methyltransferase
MTQTIQALLQTARQQLHTYVEDPYTDSQVLMSACLQQGRAWLIAHADDELDTLQADAYLQLIRQRQQGVPVAHLTGWREFWSMQFRVTPATLIPRPETEHLIEQVLTLPLPTENVSALDFGTGSGVIAVTLAKERPAWHLTAVDCSASALQVAKNNARRHDAPVDFVHACTLDTFRPVPFDLLVSNPPYIPMDDPHLSQGDVRFEPRMALASGHDGLDCIRYLVMQAPRCLKPGGYLVMEHGYDQAAVVRELLQQHDYSQIDTISDLAGHERLTAAQWHG